MKKLVDKIMAIVANVLKINDEDLLNRHADSIVQLYDEMGYLPDVEEDLERIVRDLEHDHLSLTEGGLGKYRPSGRLYDPSESWWYMDESRCMAVSV